MAVMQEVARETDTAAATTMPPALGSVRRPSPAQLIALGSAVALLRSVFNWNRSFFNIYPDGPAMLGMARWLSGTGEWHLFDMSLWRPGFPTLLAPLFWVTDDAETLVRSALLVNAVLGGVAAALLATLTSRLTDLPRGAVLGTAGIVALLPSALTASAHLWAEPLVTVCFLAATLGVLRFFDRATPTAALTSIVWAIAGTTVHARLLPFAAVVVLLVVGRAVQVGRRSLAAATAALAGLMLVASESYVAFVVDRVWNDPSDVNSVQEVLDRLRDPGAVVQATVGQQWYLLTSTVLVYGLGLVAVTVQAVRPLDRRPRPTDARLLLVLTVPLMVLSAVFVSGRSRPDQLVYGRYNDAIVWPFLACGVAWLYDLRNRQRREIVVRSMAIVPTVLVAGALVDRWHGDVLGSSLGLRAMISGLLPFGSESVDVLAATAAACLVFLALLLAATWRADHFALIAVGATLAVVAAITTYAAYLPRLDAGSTNAGAATAIASIVPKDEPIAVEIVEDPRLSRLPPAQQLALVLLYQWALPDHAFVVADQSTRYLVGPSDWRHRPAGSTVLWTDPNAPMALWHVDGPTGSG